MMSRQKLVSVLARAADVEGLSVIDFAAAPELM